VRFSSLAGVFISPVDREKGQGNRTFRPGRNRRACIATWVNLKLKEADGANQYLNGSLTVSNECLAVLTQIKGVAIFADSFDELLANLSAKQQQLREVG